VQRQDHRAEAEVDRFGHGRHGGGQGERLRQVAVLGAVVLHQVDAVEANPVGEGGHLDGGGIEFGARRAPVGRAHVEGDGSVDPSHDWPFRNA